MYNHDRWIQDYMYYFMFLDPETMDKEEYFS